MPPPTTTASAGPLGSGDAHACTRTPAPRAAGHLSPRLLPLRQNLPKSDILQRHTHAALGGSALLVPEVC